MISRFLTWLRKWDREVINEVTLGPVLKIKNLVQWRGRVIRIHKIMKADARGQFHSHPARAIRIVLWGGYVEEMEDGRMKRWRMGGVGVVSPHFVHRIHQLPNGVSYSLWLRGKERFPTYLRGPGWPSWLRNRGV